MLGILDQLLEHAQEEKWAKKLRSSGYRVILDPPPEPEPWLGPPPKRRSP